MTTIGSPHAASAPQSNTISVVDFTPSALRFEWDDQRGAFHHNVDRDVHLFVIWETAREHEREILDRIGSELTVIAEFAIQWSPDRALTNFERLYGAAVGGGTGKHEDAGTGEFVLVVAEDPHPQYRYRQNVSGYVELTNVRVADIKRDARALAGGYRVHSSNNIREFFRDATLILGPMRLDDLLRGEIGEVKRRKLQTDLVGDAGWESFSELTQVLQRTVEYVVLRNFEDLPSSLADDPEIDVLTRDALDFAAIVNGRRHHPRMGAGYGARMGGRDVTFDIRWVGDGYLDARWQQRILAQCVSAPNGTAVPRADDHFFSLLYHAKIQKPTVKPAYPARLRAIALELGLSEQTAGRVTDDDDAARLLDGFLSGHGFGVPRSVDREVYRNAAFVARLELTSIEQQPVTALREQIWSTARYSRIGERAANSSRLRAVLRATRRLVPGRRRTA